ncbi:hypothetical protein BV98_002054 [Sphingobium herbicidovorans NBRC 16415]|uniref:Uncharacterized protein n=1 Tax=Sphingobium herbicidovorans (strain ATCC 700291 / DSM 11019 / CCUG 56400 / KCTC 2939 / LMG 18315 / NBRC 16415 / MH) TaxID=1219045 RepID=A0A086P9P3_SPHHM|nr:hypothetical protein [Sphingobium herbicidovorans]KFG90111.1 hypothetical protein BV98_002054 [Sphingobium herbicidovorans NBRC 16415]
MAEKATTDDRRRFLQSCGRFAVTVPPAITVMLSTSLLSDAIAASSGGGGGGDSKGASGPRPVEKPDTVQTLTTPIIDTNEAGGN